MRDSKTRSGHAIVRSHNKFLLLRKRYGNPDNWHCPGGIAKHDEPRYKAAIRETYEETGCKVVCLKQVYESDTANYYLCRKIGGHATIKSNEIREVKWFTLEEIKALKESGRLKGCRISWFELDNPIENKGFLGLCSGCSAPYKRGDKVCAYCGREI